MMSLSEDKQVEGIEAFKSTSSYFNDLVNVDYGYFGGMVNQTSNLTPRRWVGPQPYKSKTSFPVLHHSADIFWSFGINRLIEYTVPLKIFLRA